MSKLIDDATITNAAQQAVITRAALAELIAQIKAADAAENSRAIGIENQIKDLIGTLPEGVDETNVVTYLERLVSDEASTRAAKIGAVGDGTVKDYIDGKVTEINGSADSLADRVTANESAIGVLNGEETVEGSVAKALKDAKDYADTKNSAMDGRVVKIEATHATKEDGSFKSVKEEVDAAINEFATNVTDDSVVNSFKELVDWAAEHSSDAAEMVTAIGENTAAIAAENTRAVAREDAIEDAVEAEVVRAKAAEQANATAIANEVTRATEAEGTLTTNLNAEIARAKAAEEVNANAIAALEALVGSDKVDTKIANAINTLDADVDSNADALVKVNVVQTDGVVTGVTVTNIATFVGAQEIADMFA